MKNKYNFYAAFENALCKDYITEKIFDNIKNFVIPLAYGEANYKVHVPPKSCINVNDFKTIPDLVKHLKHLSENPNEYLKYFWWRKHYKVIDHSEIYNITFCRLCQKLHEPGVQNIHKTYNNMSR